MGTTYEAICNKCGHKFSVDEGGGFVFHLLRCNKCGRDKSIKFSDLGETHLGYLKGLSGPYSSATARQDNYIRENYIGEPLSEEKYHEEVEEIAGKCGCGGQFKFKALPRCPKCNSKDIRQDPEGKMIMYD